MTEQRYITSVGTKYSHQYLPDFVLQIVFQPLCSRLHLSTMEKHIFLSVVAVACLLVAGSVFGQFEEVTHDGYVFSVSEDALPWDQAVSACEANNQKLLSVESPAKDDLLVELFVEQRNNNNVTLRGNTWVSATEVREGVWHWASLNKPLYHSRWFMDGQPDDTENLNCVYLASEWMLYWRDANCSASMYFICESRSETFIRGYD